MPRVKQPKLAKGLAKSWPRQTVFVSRYYDQADLPQPFWSLADECRTTQAGHLKWGWRQWIMLAPLIHKHHQKQGRVDMAVSMEKWQRQLKFPMEHMRSSKVLSVALSPSATKVGMDIIKLAAFIVAMPPKVPLGPYPMPGEAPETKAKSEETKEVLVSRTDESGKVVDVTFHVPQAPETPPSIPLQSAPVAAPAPGELSGLIEELKKLTTHTNEAQLKSFMATPIGVFAAPLRALLVDVLSSVLSPSRDFIAQTVKEAVIEVVGAPTPAPTPTDAEATAKAMETIRNAIKPADLLAALHGTTQPFAPPADEQDATPAPTSTPEPTPDVKALNGSNHHGGEPVAGETFEEKVANAAKALGIEPHTKREVVVCVGLNEHVKQEVKKYYGRAYRFEFFDRQDFHLPKDLPASTDAVFLCRKRMPPEILTIARRRNLPVMNVANTSQAVLWALKEAFPNHADNSTH